MNDLLQRIHQTMASRGFMEPPLSTAHLQSGSTKDGDGKVASEWFCLHYTDESPPPLLFYTLWDQYFYESEQEGVAVNILMVKNQQWADSTNLSVLGRCMGDRHRARARDFLWYLESRITIATLGDRSR